MKWDHLFLVSVSSSDTGWATNLFWREDSTGSLPLMTSPTVMAPHVKNKYFQVLAALSLGRVIGMWQEIWQVCIIVCEQGPAVL